MAHIMSYLDQKGAYTKKNCVSVCENLGIRQIPVRLRIMIQEKRILGYQHQALTQLKY